MRSMNFIIRTPDFTPIGILDEYSSAIWTERFSKCGDFEIVIPATAKFLEYLSVGNYLTLPGTDTIMVVETLSLKTEGKAAELKVSGRSLDSVLERRIVWGQMNLKGYLGSEINRLLQENMINPSVSQRLIDGWYFRVPSVNTDIGSYQIECQFTGDNLLDAIMSICNVIDAGVRVIRAHNRFEIELYKGINRTIGQFNYEPVIFSPEFDTLISSEYYQDFKNFKNTALVMGEDSGANRKRTTVYIGNSEPSGLDRRELYVDARDLQSEMDDGQTMSAADYMAKLTSRGQSKLADKDNSISTAFDGEIETKIGPEYGVDYYIGDYVTAVNEFGFGATVQITEFIRSNNLSGYSEYPTFTIVE